MRNYVLRVSSDDIRSYQSSFLTTTKSERREGGETLFVTERESQKPKIDKFTKKSKVSHEFPPWMKDKTCKDCKQLGHVKSVCPTQRCKLCRKQGHSASYCPRLSDAAKALETEE